MEKDKNPSADGARWKRLQEVGVLPSIRTYEVYKEVVAEGMSKAQRLIEKAPQSVVTAEFAAAVHELMFREIHSWAGCWARAQMVFGGYVGAPVQRLPRELEMWKIQQQESYPAGLGLSLESLERVAFTHARFIAIHPFADGNGRVGRLLLGAQLEVLEPGLSLRLDMDRRNYIGAMMLSRRNLEPLVRELARVLCFPGATPTEMPPKARIAPFQGVSGLLSLADDLACATARPIPRLKFLA
jgi:fido (protein-threonine AMPylation protein)